MIKKMCLSAPKWFFFYVSIWPGMVWKFYLFQNVLKLEKHERCTLGGNSWVLKQLTAFITWRLHANHEPIILLLFHNIEIIISNFSFSKHIERLQICTSKASLYIHKIMKHIELDISKFQRDYFFSTPCTSKMFSTTK